MNNELDWPDGFDRTDESNRRPYPHGFQVSMRKAFENIISELNKRDIQELRIETAASHLKNNPNIPYRNADPSDPGVVAYFKQNREQYAVPCDQWDNLRDNAQSIAKYLNAKRALNRYGVKTVKDKTEMNTQIYDP